MHEQGQDLRKIKPFAFWLRTGRRVLAQLADPALEVKFNPYHDPTNGQFTFAPERATRHGESVHVAISPEYIGTSRRPQSIRMTFAIGGRTVDRGFSNANGPVNGQ